MDTEDTSMDASNGASPAPTFLQWWEHLRRTGVIAKASQQMGATDMAEMAVATYDEVRSQIARQAEVALLNTFLGHPCGSA